MSNIFTPTRVFTIPNPELSGWEDFPNPCYDPQTAYGNCPPTLLDVLNDERIPANDRIWSFFKCILVPYNVKRLFAVRCARETPIGGDLFFADLLDERLDNRLKVFDVTEKYVFGEASKDDLRAAADEVKAWGVWAALATDDVTARAAAVWVDRLARAADCVVTRAADEVKAWATQLEIARSFLSE